MKEKRHNLHIAFTHAGLTVTWQPKQNSDETDTFDLR